MLMKVVKYGVVPAVVLVAVGGVLFGTDLFSYIGSSAKHLRTSVKESVPMEFELQRARDLLEDIVPEMQANIRLIAQEEVEIEALKRDIGESDRGLSESKARMEKLSLLLGRNDEYYTIADHRYNRQAVKEDLARRFEQHREAQVVLEGKKRLLTAREKSLTGAMQMLERAKSQKTLLAARIESLAGQHRLVQAASVGSRVQIDGSKLAQTQALIDQIKKRLDVAERVLAHEGRFTEPIQIDVVDEKDLLRQVNDYLHGPVVESDGKALAAGQEPVQP